VLKGGWLPAHIFLDGIAIGNILPAPLVIFATFVGYQGGLADGGVGTAFAGAILATLGMFFPCFLFTIAGHDLLEKLVRNSVSQIFEILPFNLTLHSSSPTSSMDSAVLSLV
jgi:chromate transport protein ChrA